MVGFLVSLLDFFRKNFLTMSNIYAQNSCEKFRTVGMHIDATPQALHPQRSELSPSYVLNLPHFASMRNQPLRDDVSRIHVRLAPF
jgi:hypothetical protein